MSKDTINPTKNNNMEYTDIKKYFNHIRGQLAWIPLEDEHIKNQVEGALESLKQLESFLAGSKVKPVNEKDKQELMNRLHKEFRNKYRATTSADWQTFTLGLQAMWDAIYAENQHSAGNNNLPKSPR